MTVIIIWQSWEDNLSKVGCCIGENTHTECVDGVSEALPLHWFRGLPCQHLSILYAHTQLSEWAGVHSAHMPAHLTPLYIQSPQRWISWQWESLGQIAICLALAVLWGDTMAAGLICQIPWEWPWNPVVERFRRAGSNTLCLAVTPAYTGEGVCVGGV